MGPESVVAVVMKRGIELVAAHLGLLKAEAAYLPIDPDPSVERIAFMLAGSRADALLGVEEVLEELSAGRVLTVALDALPVRAALAEAPAGVPTVTAAPQSLAYVIYTSGSTGIPKALMTEHAGAVNLAAAQAERFGANTSSRLLQFASVSVALST